MPEGYLAHFFWCSENGGEGRSAVGREKEAVAPSARSVPAIDLLYDVDFGPCPLCCCFRHHFFSFQVCNCRGLKFCFFQACHVIFTTERAYAFEGIKGDARAESISGGYI